MNTSPRWADRFWTSGDGLKLHFRDYPGPLERPPLLCLPGLTRNARDFEPVADRFAGDWRVLSIEFRGRGLSHPDPEPANYHPATYVADLLKLLDQLGVADAVFVGTSLGALVTMALAAVEPERIAGALLNDVGPELDPAGLARIATYVGKETGYASWDQAIAAIAERNRPIYPDYGPAEWDRFVRRLMREEADGRLVFDYDPRIAEGFKRPAEAPVEKAWDMFRALDGRPVTVLRGALSDLLSPAVAERMAREIGDCELVTVPGAGHAPSFDEPESIAALERLLERVLARL
jgi:pimeloyl-ACP methyl ester carboxylesterase